MKKVIAPKQVIEEKTIKNQIVALNNLETERSQYKTGTRNYRRVTSRMWHVKKWLKKRKSLPELKQTDAQPILTGLIQSLPSPSIADLILNKAIEASSRNEMEQTKVLLQTYNILRFQKAN